MYKIIRSLYSLGRITALEVWTYADKDVITENEAILICGPRPEEAK